jgi:hypothetical protein
MICRAPRPESHFTVIRNDVLRDSNLSYRARGILAAILSRPDNWRISREALAAEGREGRDAVNTALNELAVAGYIRRTRTQQPDGTWITEQTVYDTPGNWESAEHRPESADFQGPKPEKPTSGFPTVGFPDGNRRTVTKKREETHDQPSVDLAFDTFWDRYPRKVGRKKCLQWWQRHATLHHDTILDALEGWVSYWEVAVTDNRFIPHPYTWLNQERWNDPAPEAQGNARTDVVLAVLEDILDTQPALEAHNDPF